MRGRLPWPGPAENGQRPAPRGPLVARLLVAGTLAHLGARRVLAELTRQIRADGHDAVQFDPATDGPQDVDDADAVVAVLDAVDPDTLAVMGYAKALDKPVLGLASAAVTGMAPAIADVQVVDDTEDMLGRIRNFYEKVKPFAGKVVRDRIPQLVKEAGHDVAFREVTGDDRLRFLKQKIAAEALELQRADRGGEKEEIADVLEALEAFIEARKYSRDDLRRVKEAKQKRRGGFDRVWVVESTATPAKREPEPKGPGITFEL